MAISVGEPQRLKFLMRSGNAAMIDGVTSFEIERNEFTGRISNLKLEQLTDPKYARLLVETIDVSQIEAVVILPAYGPGRRANEKERSGEQ